MISHDASTSPRNVSLFNIPNSLTGIRILSIPVFVYLLYRYPNDRWSDLWAAILFGAAFWTDFFDGLIARRTQTVTKLGKIMDPMADKLIVLAALTMLVHLDRVNAVIAILLLGRELTVSALRSLAGTEGILISSARSGKLKTLFEGFSLGFLMVGPGNNWFGLPWFKVGQWLIYGALALAYGSAAIYFRDYYRGSIPPERA